MTPEQIELTRRAYGNAVALHYRGVRALPFAELRDMHRFLAEHPPLDRPLSDGAPASTNRFTTKETQR